MTTRDKHCQTLSIIGEKRIIAKDESDVLEYARVMYDETVPVVNAREVESPSSSDEEVLRAAMSKFNPPARHTASHEFDTESETDSDGDKFLNNVKTTEEQNTDSVELKTDRRKPSSAVAGSGRKRAGGVVIPAELAYDPKQFHDLKVPPDLDNIFQYIMKYTPQKIDIEFKLHPFLPEYVPAVGDIDAFIKVNTPGSNVRSQPLPDQVLEHIDNLGLTVLDEPAAEQSDSALLHLQLRAKSKTSNAKSTVLTKKIENAEKNGKAIERWIRDVSELHLSKPPPTVTYTSKMPDVDSLMEEWPDSMEQQLNEVGFPPPNIDCTLSQYVDLVCALFDIPVVEDTLNARIQALHVLFTLYTAVKNSQLYVDRQKEND